VGRGTRPGCARQWITGASSIFLARDLVVVVHYEFRLEASLP
jgi:hypothetical protein